MSELPEGDLLVRILEVAPVGFALISAPGTITWANAAYFEATGRTPEVLGKDFHAILEEDGTWSAPVGKAVDTVLRGGAGELFRSVRARYRKRPGGVFLDIDVLPIPHGDGGPAQALLMFRDVTERVEESARARLFYASFQGSTNAMQLTDARGFMVDVNPAYERIYGYSRAECIGRRPNLVRSRYTPNEVYEQMWKDLVDPARGYWSGELLNRDRSGVERPVLLSITAIRDVDGRITHYLGVAVDRSEQRNWEMRVAHADRLQSVGQLAAGVAHEINTPLANVMLIAESIRRRHPDPELAKRLETMTEQVEVAARIVRSLLDFARRDAPKVADVDLVEVARSAVGFVRGKQSADVEIEEEFPPGGVPVSGDRGQLIQVVTNLLNNAYDAMEGKGKILLAVRRRARFAELEVLDHGPGISDQALGHVFEPFFTTKPEGQGTGLGLAVCHGIVQSHHGAIIARNVPGAGASFLVSLPLRDGAAPRA
jgi:PAS domain S-box-containing protein